ncbi:MAG: hypothetical protein HYY16_13700 [Planctomycetes bacterium]|nr:hypothetical protein [Planctomycetota bacterium]
MVEFCTVCGTSLPKGDLTIRQGRAYTSPDYVCPSCGKLANPNAATKAVELFPEPNPERDIVIKSGKAITE